MGGVRFIRQPANAMLSRFGVMLLPSILSGDAPLRPVGWPGPSGGVLIGSGGTWLAEDRCRSLVVGCPVALVGLSAWQSDLTAGDYFGRYANQPDVPRFLSGRRLPICCRPTAAANHCF